MGERGYRATGNPETQRNKMIRLSWNDFVSAGQNPLCASDCSEPD